MFIYKFCSYERKLKLLTNTDVLTERVFLSRKNGIVEVVVGNRFINVCEQIILFEQTEFSRWLE